MRIVLTFLVSACLLSTATAQKKELKGDYDKIQGSWVCESGTRDGQPIPAEKAKKIKLVFKGENLTYHNINGAKHELIFKLDESKKPKQFDMGEKEAFLNGIYAISGNELKICCGHKGDPRPADFDARKGGFYSVLVLKREK